MHTHILVVHKVADIWFEQMKNLLWKIPHYVYYFSHKTNYHYLYSCFLTLELFKICNSECLEANKIEC